ncbi:MAG: metal-dependent transcriptional regulator [Anaerolineales bacterium]|jgi:DtxR family Mn-dependent transcriptional regulator|nr:metal-dependent transcriptional regulator [Anaerolineales bacterium]
MMRKSLTQPIEDYLKTIYMITRSHERATTNQIAEALEVTPASVTGMIKKLSRTNPPLVEYQRHRGVVLTPYGNQVALEILRHHRLIELFLHQILGFEWDEVHEEADRLEHVISEEFEERMALALGNPSIDPHGDPIPSRDLQMPETSNRMLIELRPPQQATISRVASADAELLRYLSSRGLTPQARLYVLEYSPFDYNMTIRIEGQEQVIVLGPQITRQIYVQPED